ncbi:MAG TPA: hypothetical protein VF937_07380 [Chloroflexota bacterium]
MIWVRAGLLAILAGLIVLALSQTAAAPPPQAAATDASVDVQPTARPTRVPFPTTPPEMIISRVARQTPPPQPTPTAAAQPLVSIVDYGFIPPQLVVPVGTTVEWVNSGSEGHDVNGTGPGGDWRSGPLAPPERYQRSFPLVGSYDYACSFHPEMRGRIVVVQP